MSKPASIFRGMGGPDNTAPSGTKMNWNEFKSKFPRQSKEFENMIDDIIADGAWDDGEKIDLDEFEFIELKNDYIEARPPAAGVASNPSWYWIPDAVDWLYNDEVDDFHFYDM